MGTKQTPETAQLRESQIIEAATEVFLRYGYARTTMGDIADAARISRPVLYLVFPRKEDIFAAVINRLSETGMAEMRAALPKYRTLGKKLHFCCEKWGAHGYDLMQIHPDARDLFNLSFPAVQKDYSDFQALLEEIMEHAVSHSKLKIKPKELALVLIFSMRGFKEVARDSAHMRQMIDQQVDIIVQALEC